LHSSKEECGDLLLHGFWAHRTDIIIDIHNPHDTGMDAKSYCSYNPHKVLAQQEREKKKKYLQSCLE
jgi:hypothetical protein